MFLPTTLFLFRAWWDVPCPLRVKTSSVMRHTEMGWGWEKQSQVNDVCPQNQTKLGSSRLSNLITVSIILIIRSFIAIVILYLHRCPLYTKAKIQAILHRKKNAPRMSSNYGPNLYTVHTRVQMNQCFFEGRTSLSTPLLQLFLSSLPAMPLTSHRYMSK